MKQIEHYFQLPTEIIDAGRQENQSLPDYTSRHALALLAYNAGLRDGSNRPPLTKVPEHVRDAFLEGMETPSDEMDDCILAALNADRAGEQPAETPAPAADDVRCDKCGLPHFKGDCKCDPTYADRHVIADSPAAAAEHVKTPMDWANEEIIELRSCLSMLISAVEGDSTANYNAIRRNAKELLRGTAHQSPAPAAETASATGLAAELDAMSAYDEIEDQVGTDDEFAAAERPLLKMLKQPTTWTEETLAFHESLICLIAALRKRGNS